MFLHHPPQRVLLIRPSALGDVCRTVAVLASLRQAFPQATIDWVVQDDFAPAVAAHPALNDLLGFPRSHLASWWKSPKAITLAAGWFNQLRKRNYDLVLDCQGLGRSGLMSFISGARWRVGLRSAREFAWLGYNVRVPQKASTPLPLHTVDQMLLLVQELGIEPVRDMRLYVADEHQKWWDEYRRLLEMSHQHPYAVLAPTSRWLSKRWPMERFAQLIHPLHERGFAQVLVIGSPSETEQVKALFEHRAAGNGESSKKKAENRKQKTESPVPLPTDCSSPAVIDLVGKTNIGQTMAVIAGAGLVIANDSAPLHMAVGFDRPCVGLFGPTDPAIVGPYQREDSVVRGYVPGKHDTINYKNPKLGDSLMRFISTVAVLQKIDRVLADASGNEAVPRAKPQAAAEASS